MATIKKLIGGALIVGAALTLLAFPGDQPLEPAFPEVRPLDEIFDDAYLLREDALKNAPDEYAALYELPDPRLIYVGFTDNIQKHKDRIAGFFSHPEFVRVIKMEHSYKYLQATQDAIGAAFDELNKAGINLTMTDIDEIHNKVIVGVADASQVEPFKSRFNGSHIKVEVVAPFSPDPPDPPKFIELEPEEEPSGG